MTRTANATRRANERETLNVSTNIWGRDVERNDFLKVPRALIRLGAYSSKMGRELQPRHILLMLDLASRRFRDSPLVVEWKNLANDLGVRVDTVRHWAYELRDMNLIKIHGQFVADFEGSRRTKGVEIDITAFVELVQKAYGNRRNERVERFAVQPIAEEDTVENLPF